MSLFLATLIATVTAKVPLPPPGGDTDAFGCSPSAGYQWCSAKQKCYRSWEESCAPTTPMVPVVPGGDTDAFGCIPSAGYRWCSAKQKCYRPWEESCAAITHTPTTNTPMAPVVPGGDMDRFGCIPSAGYQWCDTKQKCYRSWEESCAPSHQTRPTPTVPNCGGFLNCLAYNDGCNSCNCVNGVCTTKFCAKPAFPAPEMVSPAHCTSCVDGYFLNRANECAKWVAVPVPPCKMAPCVNPCEQFEGSSMYHRSPYCVGHPQTECVGHTDCVRGCYATYFDYVTGEEIVDCVLELRPILYGITTM